MEMDSTRRSFDRTREPGLKKPRLAEDQTHIDARPFPHSQRPATALLSSSSTARFRATSDRESESNDSNRGGAYRPQPQQYQELVSQYKTALAELTFNSKPIITNLTIIAGESLQAAKAIAATVCANILEVPSEQKLPSLYLLDCIVKNIGRDYIKHFAARLPEVFCKAYRQVDPSVQSSMRHLFGTWKRVFPPQSLQMIEKELGFSSAANGSSSGTATSRPDAQSRRSQHSIHVNPKYLEIQSLQQSGRARGLANDFTVPIANSTEHAESPERVAGIGAGRSWVDPPVKMHDIKRSHREMATEPVHVKKISAMYGDLENSSDISRNSVLGIGRTSGRVAEQGYEKLQYGAGNSVTEIIDGQRNGFGMKPGFPNFSMPKSAKVDLHRQPTQAVASKRSNVMSASWKNSEEEEFMWDTHSRLSDRPAANLSNYSKREIWTPDASEKMVFENLPRKPQGAHDVVSMFDRETSSDSLSTEQKETLSSPQRLKESRPTSGPAISGNSTINRGQTEGYSATSGELPMNANSSLSKMAIRQRMGTSSSGLSAKTSLGSGQQSFQSVGAASPSGQSPMRPHPSSPSFPAHSHQQLQNPMELELSRPEPSLSPSLPSFQQSHQYPILQSQQADSEQLEPSGLVSKVGTPSTLGNSEPDHSAPLNAETSGQSSTSSLLAAVMSSGILSNITTVGFTNKSFQDVGQNPLDSSIQPSLPSGTPPPQTTSEPRVTSASGPLSHAVPSVTSNVSQMKVEQPPVPPGLPASSVQTSSAMNKVDHPISNLLSSLVAKGLISASNSETSSPLPPQMTLSRTQNPSITNSSNTSTSSLPVSSAIPSSSTKDEVPLPIPDAKKSVLPQATSADMKGLIGLEFKSDIIRELHPPVICSLFEDLPHQCSICGLKLKLKERLDRHLEWHTWRKPEPDGIDKVTRRWYACSEEWVTGKAELPFRIESFVFTDELTRTVDENEPMVPADEDQCVCVLCGELFEDYYSHERKKWMFKAAVHLSLTLRDGGMGTTTENAEGPIVHLNCMTESSFYDLGLASGVEMDKDG